MLVDKQVSKCIIIYSLIRIIICTKTFFIKYVNHLRNKPSRMHVREKNARCKFIIDVIID